MLIDRRRQEAEADFARFKAGLPQEAPATHAQNVDKVINSELRSYYDQVTVPAFEERRAAALRGVARAKAAHPAATPFETAVSAVFEEAQQLLLERHRKYGPKNISASPGGALNGIRVRLHDKLARINNYVDNGGQADFADDSLRDAWIDMANYSLIALLVLDGKWPE